MPVPWDPNLLEQQCSFRRHPRDNGITLCQLRSLADFVRRLCKTLVLKHTSRFSQESGLCGQPIRWTLLNMHNINQEIILKLIPQANSRSWVEIVSADPQPPKFFVSHNWSEPFRDFMKAIELYKAGENDLGIHDPLFICTFANDQWHVDLGATLNQSPFYLALEHSEKVVLMLDKQGTSLNRTWCVFELTSAIRMHKTMVFATPLGLISDMKLSSCQVTEQLKAVDIRRAQATNPVDHRQIMNSIAEVPEEDGLIKDEIGKKFLANNEKADEGSFQRYAYEEELLRKYPTQFDQVNDYIRRQAMTRQSSTEDLGYDVPNPAGRALTLEQLRVLARQLETWWTDRGGIWSDCQIFHLIKFVSEYALNHKKQSYMEAVSNKIQYPEYLLIQVFSDKVSDFLASLEWHAEARELSASTTYWFLPAAMLKEEAEAYIAKHNLPADYCAMRYVQGAVYVIDSKASILSRAMPSLVAKGIMDQCKQMDLACPSGVIAATRPFADGFEFGIFDTDLAEKIFKFDVAKVEGARRKSGYQDAEMVKCAIAGALYQIGDKAPTECFQYRDFNKQFCSRALGPVLRGLVGANVNFKCDTERLQELLVQLNDVSDDMITLASASLRGLLGETALHIAAGGGHVEAIKVLINNKADPNQQDIDGETPMHYAALAGQHQALAMLRQSGATTSCMSYFMETPQMVAMQNPAGFLGMNTRLCEEICRSGSELKKGHTKDNMWASNLNDTCQKESTPALPKLVLCFQSLLCCKKRNANGLYTNPAQVLPFHDPRDVHETKPTNQPNPIVDIPP